MGIYHREEPVRFWSDHHVLMRRSIFLFFVLVRQFMVLTNSNKLYLSQTHGVPVARSIYIRRQNEKSRFESGWDQVVENPGTFLSCAVFVTPHQKRGFGWYMRVTFAYWRHVRGEPQQSLDIRRVQNDRNDERTVHRRSRFTGYMGSDRTRLNK